MTNGRSGRREEAKTLLVHYFALIAKRAGVIWDCDNDREVESAVDLIIDAAVEESEARRVEAVGA